MNGTKKMHPKFAMDDIVSAEERIELKFLDNHTHFLTGDIEEENIKKVIQWITYENMIGGKNEDKVLTLYINSYGGDLYQAFGLIDIMRISRFPVSTIAVGSIMSAAFMIFVSGTHGMRYLTPNAGIMCHQFSDSAEGKFHDLKSQAKENELCNSRMLQILNDASGLPERTIKSKLLGPTDTWLNTDEMLNFKLADHIL